MNLKSDKIDPRYDLGLVRFKKKSGLRAGVIRHVFPMRKKLGPGNRTDRNGIGWYYL